MERQYGRSESEIDSESESEDQAGLNYFKVYENNIAQNKDRLYSIFSDSDKGSKRL